jgi:hypothetical protein
MKFICVIILFITFISCNSDNNNSSKVTATKDSSAPKKIVIPVLEIVDSGQVYFKVSLTKNDTPSVHFEGNWPLLLSAGNSSTLQLGADKHLMHIIDMLTIYMHGLLPVGKAPVKVMNRDSNEVSIIMSQVKNGQYGLPILPNEGYLNITKNTGKAISGNFNVKAVDADKNVFILTGAFINVEANNADYIK